MKPNKQRRPIYFGSSDSEWEQEALKRKMSVDELRRQIELADRLMEEILEEEKLEAFVETILDE